MDSARSARSFFQQLEKTSASPIQAPRRSPRPAVKFDRGLSLDDAKILIGNNIPIRIPDSSASGNASNVKSLSSFSEITYPVVLVIGQTGGGKSAIVNHLFGIKSEGSIAKESSSMISCTLDINIYEGDWFGNASFGRVTIIDTPGFFDSERRDTDFLSKLTTFMVQFPKDMLKVVVITLPITETRSSSTYTKMIDQIELLIGPNVWQHTVFFTTHHNMFNPDPAYADVLRMKNNEWKKWLEDTCCIKQPLISAFQYGIPESLDAVRSKFTTCNSFTPKASEKIQLLIQSNPSASPNELVEQVEGLRKMKSDWESQINQQLKSIEATKQMLQHAENLTRRQQKQLQDANQEATILAQRLAAGPPVVYINC